jgi:nucleoside-diphosphate-sugar epimerase
LAEALIETLGLRGKTEIVTTGQSWVGDAQRWEVSLEKIEALGYRSSVTLPDGLRRTIEWFQKTE